MSYTACIFGTPFSLKAGVRPDTVRALIQEHMDDYRLDFDEAADGKYILDRVDTFEAGQSLVDRLNRLTHALGPIVADAFVLILRDADSAEDDRDSEFFGGPDDHSILNFRQRRAIDAALDILRSVPGLDKQTSLLVPPVAAADAPKSIGIKAENPAFDLTQGLTRLASEGFDLIEDLDEAGKWCWRHVESGTSSELSYDTKEGACKAALAGLGEDVATLMLHLDVTYKLNGHDLETMKDKLIQMVSQAFGEGLLTGSTAAEIDAYTCRVDRVADLDEDELAEFMSDRCENGAFRIEDLPRRLARYGMMPPGSFISEMDERMQELAFGRYAEGEQEIERNSP